MFYKHPAFVDPEKSNLKLWRYIQRDKLYHILESSTLYFCRADYLQKEDPFEGSFPKLEYEFQLKYGGGKELAMWKLYAKDKKDIAIQMDILNFKSSFNNSDETIYAGKIDYINYETDTFYSERSHKYPSMNSFSLFIHKREIYKYENEYRAICYNPNGSNYAGLNIQVLYQNLIFKFIDISI